MHHRPPISTPTAADAAAPDEGNGQGRLALRFACVRLRTDGIRGGGLRSAHECAQRLARCNVPRLQGTDGRSGRRPRRPRHGVRQNRLRVHHLQDRDGAAVQGLVARPPSAFRAFVFPPTVVLNSRSGRLGGHRRGTSRAISTNHSWCSAPVNFRFCYCSALTRWEA
jgi:hypothetical protein